MYTFFSFFLVLKGHSQGSLKSRFSSFGSPNSSSSVPYSLPYGYFYAIGTTNFCAIWRSFRRSITANDRFSGNNRYSGIKNPDHFSTIAVVACTIKFTFRHLSLSLRERALKVEADRAKVQREGDERSKNCEKLRYVILNIFVFPQESGRNFYRLHFEETGH